MAEKAEKQTYGKQAFIDAAKDSKERLVLQVVLDDEKKYTPNDVKSIVSEWKKKEVK